MVKQLLCVLLFGLTASLPAQEVGLKATAAKKDLRLGEPVVVTVEARLTVDVDSIGPAHADSAGMFQILSVKRDGQELRWQFELMSIDSGTVFMSPLEFGYVGKGDTTRKLAYSNPLSFQIAGFSIPPNADILDIKMPMRAPWKWEDIWPYLLVLVLGLAGGFVYWKYFRKKTGENALPATAPPPTPPQVLALRQLRELEDKKLWQQGLIKEYYSECTEIIRRFFEGRWGFGALEMTTDEILVSLRKANPEAITGDIEQFFVRADLAKFAKSRPTPEEHALELATAYDVVRRMTTAPKTAEEEQSTQEEAAVAG